MTAAITVAPCTIRDADPDEAGFLDLVAGQAGLPVTGDRCRARLRVAVVDGQVAGFASVTPGDGGEQLDYVYVHHHARRRGVGRALVADARAADRIRIEAHPAADTFFRRIGARQEGILPPSAGNPFCRAVFSFA